MSKLAVFAGGRTVRAALPAPATGVSRHRLDGRLAALAQRSGVTIERGVDAREWRDGALRLADGTLLRPPALFLATGKRALRGLPRGPAPDGDASVGLRVTLRPGPALARELAGSIELHLFPGGYAGLVLQEDGQANLCLAARRDALEDAGGSPNALLADWAARSGRFADRLATRVGGGPDAVAGVPYGWRAADTPAGVWRLGDQAAVIPSLAGEGLGIAVASGASAAAAFLAGESAPTWQSRFAARARRPLRVAGWLRHAGERPALTARLLPLARWPGLVDAIGRITRMG